MTTPGALVDWRLAARSAAAIAGSPDRSPGAYRPEQLRNACEEAIGTAAQYARMVVPERPPPPELVDRREWSDGALRTLASASAELEASVAAGISLPGPLGGAARRLVGLGAGAEAGLAVGYAARRVLGQYDIALLGDQRPARLLFVGPNLDRARHDLEADPELFLRWIALHETTHVLQFANVGWLVPHLRGLVSTLLEGAAKGIDPGRVAALAKRLVRDPRELARTVMHGEPTRALADPESQAALDRLQATMTVIEGHAEHVMDACVADDPRLAGLRDRMEDRRSSRGGLAEIVARLLGLDMKMRQYELGKEFWDRVVDELGEAALEHVWASPDALPDLRELEDPGAWLGRVAPPVPAR